MTRLRLMPMLAVGLIALLDGCASRPINPPITQADPTAGYHYDVRQSRSMDTGREAMVILASREFQQLLNDIDAKSSRGPEAIRHRHHGIDDQVGPRAG